MRKTASTKHFLFKSFNKLTSALFPKTNDKPPNKIDLPAPVSPVIHDIPFEKETSNSSINAKFFILNSFNNY